MTTLGATFLFLWGLGGYYIIKWFNEGETPGEVGTAIGDKLSGLTGGRLDWLMGGARATEGEGGVGEKEALLSGKSKDDDGGELHQKFGNITGAGDGMNSEKMSGKASEATGKANTVKTGANGATGGAPTGGVLEKQL
jgi:hypothetical protein